jgi:hypothetical protein
MPFCLILPCHWALLWMAIGRAGLSTVVAGTSGVLSHTFIHSFNSESSVFIECLLGVGQSSGSLWVT